MKTSLLYAHRSDKHPKRGYLPSDNAEPPFHVARFVEKHQETYHSLYPHDNNVTAQKPDSVDFTTDYFSFKNGKTDNVRIIPQEYIDRIDSIDKELKRLREEQGRIIEEAWRRGTPLRKSDLTS